MYSNWLLECQHFLQHCSLCLNVYNVDSSIQFLNLDKFLDAWTKSFFPCMNFICASFWDRMQLKFRSKLRATKRKQLIKDNWRWRALNLLNNVNAPCTIFSHLFRFVLRAEAWPYILVVVRENGATSKPGRVCGTGVAWNWSRAFKMHREV